MSVSTVYPLTDARWDELICRHPGAGVFHTLGWLSALQHTYGYEPIAFTTSRCGEPLKNALVFCKVKSWITGRRLVSLPFSDHCELLTDSAVEQEELLRGVTDCITRDGYDYAELRPKANEGQARWSAGMLQPLETFCLHRLSLEAQPGILFSNLHKNCIQRKIRRAEREKLTYESGRSETLLRQFYDLQLRTRRRHHLPPQPLRWFRNLIASLGDNLTIRVVTKGQDPVAAILTLSYKTTVTFKYGCSDEQLHNLGGIPFLLWKTMQEAQKQGMVELDLGRSELNHEGLVQFKDRLGAVKTPLAYWRYPGRKATHVRRRAWQTRIAQGILSCLPDTVFAASGRFLYRHMG